MHFSESDKLALQVDSTMSSATSTHLDYDHSIANDRQLVFRISAKSLLWTLLSHLESLETIVQLSDGISRR